jgi:hypothetical protein
MRGLPDELRAAARAWAEQTAQAQGLGPRVGAGEVLVSVALLFAPGSGPPDGRKTRVVEPVETSPAGADDQVVEHGRDDLLLPGER